MKWLEVNNRLSNLCDFGIVKLLLKRGSEERLFKFISNSSQVELDGSDHELLDFITKVAQRRLGEDCVLVEGWGRQLLVYFLYRIFTLILLPLLEGGKSSPDLVSIVRNQKLYNFVRSIEP